MGHEGCIELGYRTPLFIARIVNVLLILPFKLPFLSFLSSFSSCPSFVSTILYFMILSAPHIHLSTFSSLSSSFFLLSNYLHLILLSYLSFITFFSVCLSVCTSTPSYIFSYVHSSFSSSSLSSSSVCLSFSFLLSTGRPRRKPILV